MFSVLLGALFALIVLVFVLTGPLGHWTGTKIIAHVARRDPDEEIGAPGDTYLARWVLFKTRFGGVYVHQYFRSDDDRALHDHPWNSLSWMFRGAPDGGGLTEISYDGPPRITMNKGDAFCEWDRPNFRRITKKIGEGDWVYRAAEFAHRLELDPAHSGMVWTLFIIGPKVREWGFWCPQGWRHWEDYCTGPKGAHIGRGCQ